MLLPDTINGLFEGVGSVFMGFNVARIVKDKCVRGFNWSTCAFFGAWSLFNLFYYPHLDQWVSTVGASLMAISNTTYVMLVIYYIHKEKKE